MLIETEDETSSSPIAIPSGFFSGLARDIIERNDDALFDVSPDDEGRKRDISDRFGFNGASALSFLLSRSFVGFGTGVGEFVEACRRQSACRTRRLRRSSESVGFCTTTRLCALKPRLLASKNVLDTGLALEHVAKSNIADEERDKQPGYAGVDAG